VEGLGVLVMVSFSFDVLLLRFRFDANGCSYCTQVLDAVTGVGFGFVRFWDFA